MCSALKVSPRGFYSWRNRPESPRRRVDRRLLVEIRTSYERSHRTYGSPRVLRDLQEAGYRCARKRIARIMRENGLVAVQRRRWKATTQSAHTFPVQINLLARDFKASAPNRVWLADITFIATEEGWLYLAACGFRELCPLFSGYSAHFGGGAPKVNSFQVTGTIRR